MASNPLDQLSRDAARLDRFLKGAPRVMGQLAVRQFVGSFQRQAFIDEAGQTHAWPERKRADKKGRALLVRTGRLRRSIRVTGSSGDSVTIGSDVPYAQVHNEGATITGTATVRGHRRRRYEHEEVSAPSARKEKWVRVHVGTHEVRAHSRTLHTQMPQRQFMGASKALNDDVLAYLHQGVADATRATENVTIKPA